MLTKRQLDNINEKQSIKYNLFKTLEQKMTQSSVNASTQCAATSSTRANIMSLGSIVPPSSILPGARKVESASQKERRDHVLNILDEVLDILNDDDDIFGSKQ